MQKKIFLSNLIFFLFIYIHFSIKSIKPSKTTGFNEIPLANSVYEEYFCQLNPSIAPLSDGGFAVVWQKGAYPNLDIALQWLTPQLQPKFPIGGIEVTSSLKNESEAVIAPHSSNGVFVAYSKSKINNTRIKVQYYDEQGNPMWPGDGVYASPVVYQENQDEPHLVPDPWGGVYVCYRAWYFDPNIPDQIKCQHLDSKGKRLWKKNALNSGGTKGLKVYPRSLPDDQGGVLVFWRNQGNPFDDEEESMLMEGQHFTSTGKKLWGNQGKTIQETNLAESNGWSFTFYNAVSDGKGGAILVFNDWKNFSDPNLDVVAQRISYKGKILWKDGAVVTQASGHQQHECSIPAGKGGVFVIISQIIKSTQNQLFVYRLNPKGKHKWAESGILLSDPINMGLDYGVCGYFNGKRLPLIWTHQLYAYSSNYDILTAQLTRKGKLIGDPARTMLVDAQEGQFTRDIAYNTSSGCFFAAWDDYRNSYTFGNCDVYGGGQNDNVSQLAEAKRKEAAPYSILIFNHEPNSCRIKDGRLISQTYVFPGRKREKNRVFEKNHP